ncbi:peptidase S15 [Salinisphaera sp. PC39]|uniref:CocE/NonD family hydrolase n=1 Tax=Salinisphaera sp. PC39 TaxID=1304156 RepID=UPI0033408D13
MRYPFPRRAGIALCTTAAVLLAGCNSGGSGGGLSGDAADLGVEPVNLEWTDYGREASHPGTAALDEQFVTMSDGERIAVNVTLPADAQGEPVAGPVPTILTLTGYNKNIPAIPASNEFLIRRGYAHVSVDVRGTGNSTGNWEAFSEREQQDYLEIMEWVAAQPWCDGNVGTWGASFMGITQLFTAAHQHPAHKAVFAIVPMGDAYRDIVFTGGQTNVGFIPLWMGLVTALGAIPPQALATDPALGTEILLDHVLNALTNFTVPTIANAVIGGGRNYDSEFWRTRSPLEVTDRIDIPTFIVGGLNDIFQRGEPLLYEALRDRVDSKLLIGPWQHLGGSSGEGLPADGVPDLDHLALRWFDRYLRGMDTGAETAPPVTQYYYGAERYVTAADWPHPEARATRLYLQPDGGLDSAAPTIDEGSRLVLQQPVNGLCSASTSQWTAGILGLTMLPCFEDNRLTETLELTYTTAPMTEDFAINGPIQADIWLSTTALDAGVVVRVTDVAPDGGSRELTNGILTASLRAVDEDESRYLDGEMIQPWHPYTAESRQTMTPGEVVHLPIEVFPTSAVIREGHRLRVTVGASDFPHGLPPLTDLVDQLAGVMTVYSDAERPSSVVFPTVPLSALGSE